jgi:hypothetical protein
MPVHVTMMKKEFLKPIHVREEGSWTTPVNNFKTLSAAGTTRHGNGECGAFKLLFSLGGVQVWVSTNVV